MSMIYKDGAAIVKDYQNVDSFEKIVDLMMVIYFSGMEHLYVDCRCIILHNVRSTLSVTIRATHNVRSTLSVTIRATRYAMHYVTLHYALCIM